MNELKKCIVSILIYMHFSSAIQALHPKFFIPPEYSYLFYTNSPESSWFDASMQDNHWQNTAQHIFENYAFETSMNFDQTTLTVIANTKIITLSVNTKLLTAMIILAIAYKFDYFNKIKKYFIASTNDDDEKEQNS